MSAMLKEYEEIHDKIVRKEITEEEAIAALMILGKTREEAEIWYGHLLGEMEYAHYLAQLGPDEEPEYYI